MTTGGQRIHDYDTQVAKMLKKGMNPEDFAGYLMIHKYGTCRTAASASAWSADGRACWVKTTSARPACSRAISRESSRKGDSTMEINDKLVSYVAELAHLKLDDDQRAQAAADLSRMIGYVDQLAELDTDGVEPMSHVFPLVNVFREDEVKPSMARELILQNAPKQKDGCFLVPKTVE